jgi:hypothetical protein
VAKQKTNTETTPVTPPPKSGKFIELTESQLRERIGNNFKPPVRDFAVTLLVGSQGAGKTAFIDAYSAGYELRNKTKTLILAPVVGRSLQKKDLFSYEDFLADSRRNDNHEKKWKTGTRMMPITIEQQEEILNAKV